MSLTFSPLSPPCVIPESAQRMSGTHAHWRASVRAERHRSAKNRDDTCGGVFEAGAEP